MKSILIFALLLLSCKTIDRSASQVSGLAYKGRLWENPRDIPVCIVNRSQISDDIFIDLRDWVRREYKERADIGFNGWEQCSEADYKAAMIRIYFYPGEDWDVANPITSSGLSQVGRFAPNCAVNCDRGTMRLTVGKKFRYPDSDRRDELRNYLLHTTMHEFGHALGLMHEHLRGDANKCREDMMTLPEGEQYAYIGNYDPDSIMNYCKNHKTGFLSAGDVVTLRTLYFPENWAKYPISGASDVGGGADESLWYLGSKGEDGNGFLYHLADDLWRKYQGISGAALDVGPDGKVWLVKANGEIFQFDGKTLTQVPGLARDIAVGSSGAVWILRQDGSIAFRDKDDWKNIVGNGIALDVGPDGNPWMVDEKHRIWQWSGNEWIFVDGSARDIAVGKDGFPWIISNEYDGKAYRLYKWNGGGWIARPISAQRVSVRGFDHPIVIDENNDLLAQ